MAQVWKIAPGVGAEDWDVFREKGCIGLGWLTGTNYRDYQTFQNQDEVLTTLQEVHGMGTAGASAGSAKMIWQFVHEVKPQHVVVANDKYNKVVGIGVITGEYVPPSSAHNPLWEDTTTHRHHVRLVNWLITDPIELPGKRFFVQSTLWPLESSKLTSIRQAYSAEYPHLKAILDELLVGFRAAVAGSLPEEVDNSPALFEGAKHQITVNAYERNPVARQKCIAAHGTTCLVCGFNFGAVYGPDAEGYIHVHHLKPLSDVGGEYEVDPVAELRPVCPNCHAVLHLGGECRSIQEVKQMLAQQKVKRTESDT